MPRYSKRIKEIMTTQMRSDIHNASIAIIREEGWKGFTTEKIAEKMGVSRGVLYNYFKNKEAIVNSLVAEFSNNFCTTIKNICKSTASGRDRLQQIYEYYIENFNRDFETYYQIFSNNSYVSSMETIIKGNCRITGLISAIISEGITSGEFIDNDPNTLGILFFSGLKEICLQSRYNSRSPSYQKMLNTMLNTITQH